MTKNCENYMQSLGEVFCRETVCVKNKRQLRFAKTTQLKLLAETKTWYINGTFKVVKVHLPNFCPSTHLSSLIVI